MSLYLYKAVNKNGKITKGWITASSSHEVKYRLKKENNTLLSCKTEKEKKKVSFSRSALISFTRELTKLLNAGLPLYESLSALEEKYQKNKVVPIIFSLKEQIKKGVCFSEALSLFPGSFDFLFCSMIENAEKSGTLEKTLEDLSTLLEKQENLKKQILGSLLYPGILFCFSIFIVLALIFFIIPSLYELFEGKSVHPLTEVVLSTSLFLNQHRALFFSSGTILISIFILLLRFEKTKRISLKLFLYLPGFKHLFIKVALIRFCRALCILLTRGVGYVQALKLARKLMKHPYLEKQIEMAEKHLIQGGKLSDQLRKASFIPPLVPRMLSVAEDSGDISVMLQHIADFYEDEMNKTLLKLTTLIQPVILLFLGVIIGGIVLAVLLPLMDVGSFISD
jgi:general secretion pathway protein F